MSILIFLNIKLTILEIQFHLSLFYKQKFINYKFTFFSGLLDKVNLKINHNAVHILCDHRSHNIGAPILIIYIFLFIFD
jgi:hypothetical protein